MRRSIDNHHLPLSLYLGVQCLTTTVNETTGVITPDERTQMTRSEKNGIVPRIPPHALREQTSQYVIGNTKEAAGKHDESICLGLVFVTENLRKRNQTISIGVTLFTDTWK